MCLCLTNSSNLVLVDTAMAIVGSCKLLMVQGWCDQENDGAILLKRERSDGGRVRSERGARAFALKIVFRGHKTETSAHPPF